MRCLGEGRAYEAGMGMRPGLWGAAGGMFSCTNAMRLKKGPSCEGPDFSPFLDQRVNHFMQSVIANCAEYASRYLPVSVKDDSCRKPLEIHCPLREA